MYQRTFAAVCLVAVLLLFGPAATTCQSAEAPAGLEEAFSAPPDSARPWVYWFWKNGNISREGITADLEAMERVGIGGAIMMEVALSVPPGPVTFFSQRWRELFEHAVDEAGRLGLKISINSAPGWTGSGGPWVKPEQSMQKVVSSETKVSGPRQLDRSIARPETLHGFYREIVVLAFPTPEGDYRIADIREKALYERGPISSKPGVRHAFAAVADYEEVAKEELVPIGRIVDLTEKMDDSGRLIWEVPQGDWTILRFGRTSTGQTNRPAALPGLECDKLDTKALDDHFRQFTAQLLADVGSRAGQTLVATHLDSWEVGAQNWTGEFPEAFRQRRGYDPLPYLPVTTGRVVESLEVSERFLWDLRQTVSEMIVENHGRHMHELARRHGLWLSIEPYDMTPCDDMTLGATADVPMCEFWSSGFDTRYAVKEATSVGHVYGKPVVAAEAFTSGHRDAWQFHPASVKALGDWAFCEGVNRFVVHRYIHQPFIEARPGLSLGPHGLHYERTQTWWEMSGPWHEYLARCQHVLQQGLFVADVLYLSPEGAPNVFQMPLRAPQGFKFDACTPEALLTRVSVRDGRLTLPDGMSYRLLVLPEAETMTPAMLGRISQLVNAGATVVGAPPRKSPSLSGYPDCDDEVRQLADALWGGGAMPAKIAERRVGKGRVIWGDGLKNPRPSSEGAKSIAAQAKWIWPPGGNPAASEPVGKAYFRRTLTLAEDVEIEAARVLMTADNSFELWINGRNAGQGQNFHQFYPLDVKALLRPGVNLLAVAAENGGDSPNPAGLIGTLLIRGKSGPEHVVHTDQEWEAIRSVGEKWTSEASSTGWAAATVLGPLGMPPWGKPHEPVARHDVYPPSEAIEALLERMGVSPDFAAGRPLRYAHRRIGRMEAYFVSNPEDETVKAACTFRVTGMRPELWHPETGETRPLGRYSRTEDGRTVVPLRFGPAQSYFVVFRPPADVVPGRDDRGDIGENFREFAPLTQIKGPWNVTFDSRLGGPEAAVTFDRLEDWSKRPETGIKYYSGSATYAKPIDISPEIISRTERLYLDLGRVEVMAEVELNGKPLAILWKPPFRVEITGAVRPGTNDLKIRVVNLWPNRMIGDERLPEDSKRRANGTLEEWPKWLLEGKPSPSGRYTFATWRHWNKNSPLLESGLLGPVRLTATR